MDNSQKTTFYHWRYDDGAWGYAVREKAANTIWTDWVPYTSKKEANLCYKKYAENGTENLKRKRLRIPAGLDEIPYYDTAQEAMEPMLNGIQAMLDSCGTTPDAQREMLRLVASVLAGYCARSCSKQYRAFLSPRQRRAPIIIVKQAPYADIVLEYVIRSLALDSTEHATNSLIFNRKIHCKYRPVLPKHIRDEKITDCAWMKLDGFKHRMLPQYRDTALMLYGWMLRGKESRRFQSINRWVSLVLYDFSSRKTISSPIVIKGNELSSSDCSWKKKEVQLSVIKYAHYISQRNSSKSWRKMLRKQFSGYDAAITSHNENSNTKIKPAERYLVSMQLLALHLFLEACTIEDDLDPSQAAQLEQKWFKILLPDCSIINPAVSLEDDPIPPLIDMQAMFEKALTQILENGFPEKFYIEGKSSGSDLWGDIGAPPEKEAPKDVLAIRMSVEQLKTLLEPYSNGRGGKWFYEHAVKLHPPYMSPIKKIRIKALNKNKSQALYFTVNEMRFLPEDLYNKLMHALPGNGSDAKISPST